MNRGFDIVVVGAGPAGLAASAAAARAGRRVALLDENPQVGGQIWRASIGKSQPDRVREDAFAAFETSGAELFAGRQVVDAALPDELKVWVDSTQMLESFAFSQLIVATGARERFLPFPGWTLPGVFGAGGLQALVRGGYDVRGKRVIVAGTGPLLLAVAAHLKHDGAKIVSIHEQAPMRRLAKFGAGLLSRPGKIFQGLGLRAELAGIPYTTGSWPVEAEGCESVTAVRLSDGQHTWTENCDLLACGFHLVPNTELASLLGCSMAEGVVQVDANQQTSQAGIYCAGEPTGVAGVDAARLQGEIAGLAAAGLAPQASRLHGRRNAEAAFGRAMSRAFTLRPELLSLAKPDTIVCRCEDVRFDQVQAQAMHPGGWTDAKLQTRCGMGSCQGRVCGSALEAIFGWRNTSIRSPLFPIPVAAMCSPPSLRKDEISIPNSQETLR
jgi:NADPH-dependent 2,4-dienoyl-CoA reductase/sulfur reductase-like enzyme